MENLIETGAVLSPEIIEKINGIEMIIVGILWFYIFLRILSIIRVSRDIHARTNSTIVQLVSILFITLFSPIIGLPIYITMRPVQYKRQ